jgi:hypothetical protein
MSGLVEKDALAPKSTTHINIHGETGIETFGRRSRRLPDSPINTAFVDISKLFGSSHAWC